MIDLDEQLSGYGRYLEDTTQPARAQAGVDSVARTDHPDRHRLAVAAAVVVVALCVVGLLAAIAESGRLGVGSADGDWTEVDSPDAPVGSLQRRDGVIEWVVAINSVAATTHGWLAVGTHESGPWFEADIVDDRVDRPDEQQLAIAAAPDAGLVWVSPDGMVWEPVAVDSQYESWFVDVTERDGRVVIAGWAWESEQPGERYLAPLILWSDDLETWNQHTFDMHHYASAVAAGPVGFVLGGGGGANEAAASTWFSPDGESWQRATVADDVDTPGDHASDIHDVAALGDGFVAVGEVDGQAAAWTSVDGIEWVRAEVEPNFVGSDLPRTWMASVAVLGDIIVGYGTGHDGGLPYRPVPVAWVSTDGRTWKAHRISDLDAFLTHGPIFATDDEFIVLASEASADGSMQWELRSADGVTWDARPLELDGQRSAAAYADGDAVAVGESRTWVRRDW